MDGIERTAQQRTDAEVIADVLMAKMRVEAKHIAELPASKSSGALFGATEFQVRDILLELGAEAFATALEERKKKGPRIQPDVFGLPGVGEVHGLSLMGYRSWAIVHGLSARA